VIEVIRAAAELQSFFKAFASRAKDWMDIEGIIVRQTGKLHWEEVWNELKPLAELKGAPEIVIELEKRRIEFEQ